MAGELGKWCPVCGAMPGEPCTVTAAEEGLEPGDERPEQHFYRQNDVPVPDVPQRAA